MCDVIEDAEAGVYGHWLQPLPPVALQRLHPAEFRWVDLVGFLDNLGSLDLHKRFLKLGQVDRLLIGPSAQQMGTTAWWYSNKTSLHILAINFPWLYNYTGCFKCW